MKRVKLGIDPTAKDLHLGHTVVLRKLRQFQDAGDQAVLIIGDFTALVGDPSGRNDARPMLTPKQVKENEKNYLELAGKIINLETAEVRHNSEWYAGKSMEFLMDLLRRVTVSQIMEREDFKKRIASGADVNMLETIYPLLQGYDSVAVRADVEIGGVDQTLNMHMGRKLQRRFNMSEQEVITVPLLVGLDGVQKMSKSKRNYVAIDDAPGDMFGKLMSIPDSLMQSYYELLTGEQFDTSLPPKIAKEHLAELIVNQYHGPTAAKTAQEEFARVFSKGEVPEQMPEHTAGILLDVLVDSKLVSSKAEAHRLLKQRAVKINGETVDDGRVSVNAGDVVKVGARRFLRIL